MGKADVSMKDYISDKERFADLFNAYLFDGATLIDPNELIEITNESNVILPDNMGKKRAVTRFGDIRMKWRNVADLAILTTEFQDKIHYAMPVKSMILDSLCYIDQIREIWRSIDNSEEKKNLSVEEIFSRFRKEDKLCPVIPIVFYYGDDWDGNISLYDMFSHNNLILDGNYKNLLSKYVPNYTINLFNPTKLSDYSIFKTDLQIMFGMLQYKEDKNALRNYIYANEEYFSNMSLEAANAAGTLLRNDAWFDKAISNISKNEEDCNMCKAIDDMINDGRIEGKILAFYEMGLSLEAISDKMSMPIHEIKRILASTDKE